MKLFSIRVRELFQPIVLRKKATGFDSFLKSVFNWKLMKKKWNVVCGRKSQLYVSHYVQKDCWIRALIKQLLTKYQIFTKLPQISHTHKNHNLLSVIGNWYIGQLFVPYKLYDRDIQGIYIFRFCQLCAVNIMSADILCLNSWFV